MKPETQPSELRAMIGGLLLQLLMGSLKAVTIVLLGELSGLVKFSLTWMIVTFCVLESAKFPLFRDSIQFGRDRFRAVKERRQAYIKVMTQRVKEQRWPTDPFRALATVGLILSNALLRGWIVVVLAYFLQRLFSSEPTGNSVIPWLILTLVEGTLIVMRAFGRGTLTTIGMSMDEMDAYHQAVIERHRGKLPNGFD